MNFAALESAQKLRGGFYTDPTVASFLLKWVTFMKPTSILEPSCGDGIFLEMIEKQRIKSLKHIVACEIEPNEAQKALARTRLSASVLNVDFLKWFLFEAQDADRYDSVVGNPPFIRYQYLSERQQFLAEKVFSRFGLPFTRHTNAWVPFVLASIALLKPGGRMGMVVPSEIFHIPHAASLRRYIAEQCLKVLIVDPQEIWFGDTLQGTVLILAEKKRNIADKSEGIAIIPIKDKASLSEDPEHLFRSATYVNDLTLSGKWMPIFLQPNERVLLARLRESHKIRVFSDIASVDVGIVTGANNFFLVSDETVRTFGLKRWAHPMFGRSAHVKGLVFSMKDYKENRSSGLPANFLQFNGDIEDQPPNVQRYLKKGCDQQLHKRFKCRTRKLWYKIPSVYSAPIAMLKRAHNYPRLVLNKAGAYTTDTAYRIKPICIKPSALVLGFLNSLTCLTAELEGRHYGGGVIELVPSEIERLLIPMIDASIADLYAADRKFRHIGDDIAFLRDQDSSILGKAGLTINEQNILHEAWLRLRCRRLRIQSPCEISD